MFVVECSYGAELDTPKSSELQSHKLVCSFLAWSMGVGVFTPGKENHESGVVRKWGVFSK
jgi:hypothetical protein